MFFARTLQPSSEQVALTSCICLHADVLSESTVRDPSESQWQSRSEVVPHAWSHCMTAKTSQLLSTSSHAPRHERRFWAQYCLHVLPRIFVARTLQPSLTLLSGHCFL